MKRIFNDNTLLFNVLLGVIVVSLLSVIVVSIILNSKDSTYDIIPDHTSIADSTSVDFDEVNGRPNQYGDANWIQHEVGFFRKRAEVNEPYDNEFVIRVDGSSSSPSFVSREEFDSVDIWRPPVFEDILINMVPNSPEYLIDNSYRLEQWELERTTTDETLQLLSSRRNERDNIIELELEERKLESDGLLEADKLRLLREFREATESISVSSRVDVFDATDLVEEGEYKLFLLWGSEFKSFMPVIRFNHDGRQVLFGAISQDDGAILELTKDGRIRNSISGDIVSLIDAISLFNPYIPSLTHEDHEHEHDDEEEEETHLYPYDAKNYSIKNTLVKDEFVESLYLGGFEWVY